jgi:hypothetical protein
MNPDAGFGISRCEHELNSIALLSIQRRNTEATRFAKVNRSDMMEMM